MKDLPELSGNIRKLYWLQACSGALIHVPIVVLFYMENGLTMHDIFLLQGIYAGTVLLWEIPTGYLSDRFGRVRTTVIGSFIIFLGMLTYCLSAGIAGFLLGEILLATGRSFHSGTIDALTYDSLLQSGKEATYRHVISHQRFYLFGAEAIGSVLAGGLALLSLRATLWTTLFFFGIACIVSLTLMEPDRQKLTDTRHLHAIWRIAKQTLHHRAIRSITILYAVISTLALALFWFTQSYQEMVGLPLTFFGIVHAVILTAGALASKYTHTMERWIDDRLFLSLIALALLGSIIALGFVTSLWGLLLFLIIRVCWSFNVPLTSDMVNRLTTSDIRATVLSIKALTHRLLFAIAAPFIGYAADVYTLNQAILMTGIVGAIGVAIAFLMMRPVWGRIPK